MDSFSTLLSSLKAAAEPTRLRLLALLARAELTVTEITQVLGQSQPRVSRHLKLLVDAGLLDRVREGAWVFYRMADRGAAADIARVLTMRLDPGDTRLQSDHMRLDGVRLARQEAAAAFFRANAAEWDRIRSLHVPDTEVEAAVLAALGERRIGDLLDLGTGTGRMLEVAASRFERGLGFDLSHDMLSVARANLERAGLAHCTVRQGDLLRLPMATGNGADAIIIHQVLHFLENPGLAIAEAARVLRPHGRIVIVDFAPHGLETLRETQAHRRLGLSDKDMAAWAADADLRIAETVVLPAPGPDRLTVCVWTLLARIVAPAELPLQEKVRA